MIEFKNVSIRMGSNLIFKDLHLKIKKNEKVFVIGASGAGKTTLINSLTNPGCIVAGSVYVNETNLKQIRRRSLQKLNASYGYISQKDFFINWETVFYNIKNLYPNYKNAFLRFFNIMSKSDKAKIFATAQKLKINDLLFKTVADISGGEKQRIKILLLLLQKPPIILADEPTSSLDVKISRDIIKEIYALKNALLILNIHKLDLIPPAARRVVAIKNGQIIFDGTRKNLTEKVIKATYE